MCGQLSKLYLKLCLQFVVILADIPVLLHHGIHLSSPNQKTPSWLNNCLLQVNSWSNWQKHFGDFEYLAWLLALGVNAQL
jgi:hypothetical protein